MARKVFENSMVAHVWAQQNQNEGRNSSQTFWFEGSVIYSYRQPVGNIIDGAQGQRVALIWSGSYSNTTNRHLTLVDRAVGGPNKFRVPDVLDHPQYSGWTLESRHANNVKYLLKRYTDTREVIIKASKNPTMNQREYLLDDVWGISAMARECRLYCEAFGLVVPREVAEFNIDALRGEVARNREVTGAKRRERDAKLRERLGTDEAVREYHERCDLLARASAFLKRRHGNMARFIEQGYAWYRELDQFAGIKSDLETWHRVAPDDATISRRLDEYRGIEGRANEQARERIAERERLAAAAAERARIERECRDAFDKLETDSERLAAFRDSRANLEWLPGHLQLALWRSREVDRLPYGAMAPPQAALRLSADGNEVETSMGARFPAEHARIAWRALRVIYARGEEWQSTGRTIKLGHFAISRVDLAGTIIAGCHHVARSEAERLAKALGLSPVMLADRYSEVDQHIG